MAATEPSSDLKPLVGWREWVALPGLGLPWVKAKIDTGARSSALHAFDLHHELRQGEPWVRFVVHPWQRSDDDSVAVEAPLIDRRTVRSSNGSASQRPVIATTVEIGGIELPVELTLARRDQMGFRLLIGRQTLNGNFAVDPEASFLGGRPPLGVRRANRRRPDRARRDRARPDRAGSESGRSQVESHPTVGGGRE